LSFNYWDVAQPARARVFDTRYLSSSLSVPANSASTKGVPEHAKSTPLLTQTGVTTDGKPVISFFPIVESRGQPLEIVVSYLDSHGFMPDWLDFYDTAVEHGWKPDRVKLQLERVVGDVYGPDFLKVWQEKFLQATAERV